MHGKPSLCPSPQSCSWTCGDLLMYEAGLRISIYIRGHDPNLQALFLKQNIQDTSQPSDGPFAKRRQTCRSVMCCASDPVEKQKKGPAVGYYCSELCRMLQPTSWSHAWTALDCELPSSHCLLGWGKPLIDRVLYQVRVTGKYTLRGIPIQVVDTGP